MAERVDYQQFVTRLRELVRMQATTKAVLVTDDHHSLWVGLTHGVITTLLYGPKRGRAAIPLIRQITGGSLALRGEIEIPATPDIPSTDEILAELASAVGVSAAELAATPAPAPAPVAAPAAPTPPPAPAGGPPIPTDQVIADLQKILNGYLGPIASMILNNTVRSAGGMKDEGQFQQVVEALAKEVEGIGDVRKFRADALATLKRR